VFQAVEAWKLLLAEQIGEADKMAENDDVQSQAGVAINVYEAFLCLTDCIRTAGFVRGLAAAVHEAQARFPGECIRILYAGCGPYAALFQPLTSLFSEQEIAVTLIEINSETISMAQKTVEVFGWESYVDGWVEQDLLTWTNLGKPYHVAVTETMQKALVKEGQILNSQHLVTFLCPHGLLVPQEVRITAATTAPEGSPGAKEVSPHLWLSPLADVFKLNLDTVPGFSFPYEYSLDMDKSMVSELEVYLLTEVRVFEDHILHWGDSCLTYPVKVLNGMIPSPSASSIVFRLGPKEHPHWQVGAAS